MQVKEDLKKMEQAIRTKDFLLLGETAEKNAILMHETMHDAKPSVNYDLPKTTLLKEKIKRLRNEGMPIYFTQDAGPNIKLLFLKDQLERVQHYFSSVEIVGTAQERCPKP